MMQWTGGTWKPGILLLTIPLLPSLLLLLTTTTSKSVSASPAPQPRCIGSCVCDKDHQLIDCHKKGLESFPTTTATASTRSSLSGYTILSLVNNQIKADDYPTEAELLRLIPDLKLIDLTDNSENLDCPKLTANFPNVIVVSKCMSEKDQKLIQEHFERVEDDGPKQTNAESAASTSDDVDESECDDIWCRMKQKLSPGVLEAYGHIRKAWSGLKDVQTSVQAAFNAVMDVVADGVEVVRSFVKKILD